MEDTRASQSSRAADKPKDVLLLGTSRKEDLAARGGDERRGHLEDEHSALIALSVESQVAGGDLHAAR